MTDLVGAAPQGRYDEVVAEGRSPVGEMGRRQFRIGDIALEIAPMRAVGGHSPPVVEGPTTVAPTGRRPGVDPGAVDDGPGGRGADV
ncbi:hypothetical protein ACFWOG_29390 [Kitasatospora sp. NPDC058406]|uniref:hypothetical protein n=1 Tax=Kitasatospora sp. NPDC058406 TaxID=3346483 RepID=UPI0036638145